jgi:hypothetical protein
MIVGAKRTARSVNGTSTMAAYRGGDAPRHAPLMTAATGQPHLTRNRRTVSSPAWAVSRPGSNYSKAAEIEFRRREIVGDRDPDRSSRSPNGCSRSPKGCDFAFEAGWMGHYRSCRSNAHTCATDRLRWAADGRLQQARSTTWRMIANTSSPTASTCWS